VIFGFLAIECIGEVALMKLEQCAGGDRCQWNALVGRAEQQVEVDFRVFDSISIKRGQRGEVGTTIEYTGIEKNLRAPRCRQ
jgi:hypothetical protein